jgi:hypothetical protein
MDKIKEILIAPAAQSVVAPQSLMTLRVSLNVLENRKHVKSLPTFSVMFLELDAFLELQKTIK